MVVAVGLTESELPVVTKVPPQLPLYHFQLADVPNVPPEILRVLLWPSHIVAELALAKVAGTEVSLTVITMLLQTVLLQVPSARTKYVLVVVGFTAILLPVPTEVPPQLPVYHFQLAEVPKAPPFTLSVVL